MNNKEIKGQRIRGYFMDATREIIRTEGIEAVNVRAVARKAGYSYATIYNYFRDVRELLFMSVQELQEEIRNEIISAINSRKTGRVRIPEVTRYFVAYFLKYPGIFELFYLEKTPASHPSSRLIYDFYDDLVKADWDLTVELRVFTRREATVRQRALKLAVVGLLVLYLNRNQPETYDQFRLHLEETLSLNLGEPLQG